MTKQELARNRNFFKRQVLGVYANLSRILAVKESMLTNDEHWRICNIKEYLETIINKFDISSEEKGLNIYDKRCSFCRRKAIVNTLDGYRLCKLHKEEYE